MMLYKILLKEGGLPQFIAAIAGSIIGLILLMASTQFYFDIKGVLNENSDLIKPDYLIINKKVSTLTTAGFSKATFREREMAELREQKFVKEIAPFVSNGFEVKAYSNPGYNVPAIYTDMFFEALPDEYLDIPQELWKWAPGDSIVPIAVPRDYLNLYNFGYALSKGMPQIAGSMISMLKFQLTLTNKNVENATQPQTKCTGQIVGFTDRINTILVPRNFLIYMNKQLNTTAPAPSRILIVAKDPSDKSIPKFLSERNYETNKEKLKNSKLNILLNIMMSVLTGLSLTIIFLSFMTFTLAFQLLITKKQEKIRTLLYLGFGVPQVIKYYVAMFVSANVGIFALAWIATSQLKDEFFKVMIDFNFPVAEGTSNTVILIGLGITVLITVLNTFFLFSKVAGMDNGRK
ncbi:MAG: hypothetical protein PHV24_06180 [Candidatus Kapabacteria bacterium]|nr:hypothetical protein [Candidatus Kapabacteria bacterium]